MSEPEQAAESSLERKASALRRALSGDDGLLVAFSAGVDSSLLLAEAARAHRGRVLAVTVVSELQPLDEAPRAAQLAQELAVEHQLMQGSPLSNPWLRANPPERCYLCKRQIFGALVELAAQEGLARVVEGSNVDDDDDYRPGRRAIEELGVASPLKAAGLTKAEVRALARQAGLPNWDRPSQACLASRIPYGEPLTAAKLARVGEAEALLRRAGFDEVRLRDHGELARIEVPQRAIGRFADAQLRAELVEGLEALGFVYVTIDLKGYRTGAMNETLTAEARSGSDATEENTR
jgi:pyridinium-3,5-biscarboxylic acid mononucleotide sulfurtransferase